MGSRKRRRLDNAGLDDYINNVDSGQTEGVFGTNLCTEDLYPNDPDYKKFRERDTFEIQPLMLDGVTTGWARCTLPRCQEQRMSSKQSKIFQIQQKNRDGVLKRNLFRHFEQWHLTDEEQKEKREAERLRRIAGKRKVAADSAQPSMELFAKPALKKLNPQSIEELQKLNAAIIAEAGLSLDFFTKESIMERDRFLLKSVGYDPDQVQRINRGKHAVKEDLFKAGSENARLIRSVAPQLADKGRLAMMIDHQAILHLKKEDCRDAMGSGLVLSASSGKRHDYLMGYEATGTTGARETVRIARQHAKERK